ncbi:MAG: hypothetical protein AAB262_00760 [Elusimicrobiota bacterium]
MKTPINPFTALALALILVGAETSSAADIVPDDFIGPLAPGQIYRSKAMQSIDPGLESSPFAVTTNALQDIGRLQQAESGVGAGDPKVIAEEDRMKADGTLKDVIRQPNGAILVLPNGKVSWSDYTLGFNSIPYDPASCAGNPGCPASLKTYLGKQAEKEKMFSTSGNKNTSPEPAQDPPSDAIELAANDLGKGIGMFQDPPSPDSTTTEVGQAEVPALSNIRYSYRKVQEASDKASKIVKDVTANIGDASGKKDLDANTSPSKGIVATHQ